MELMVVRAQTVRTTCHDAESEFNERIQEIGRHCLWFFEGSIVCFAATLSHIENNNKTEWLTERR